MIGKLFKMEKKSPKEFNSKLSKKWRELYSPHLLDILKHKVNVSEIIEMYSLVFFLATDKNLNDAISYANERQYKKLSEMLNRVPIDYDEKSYLTYDLVYIIRSQVYCIAFILDNDDGKNTILLKYFSEVPPLNLELFPGRRLIYPV